ncbi:hypothetical protein SADUNF_Sadunf16G0011600 [Salix dunnii]|uniref:Association with the SNF1 complex (ASC) domain-containing protein n=1 Tax=Salix dunnii TaxID=1413687 RepID=A0A835MFP5_9ROSI|nr:hypothetical protein SADUNF_Sadunf16G0011600 [Salix dunnii]
MGNVNGREEEGAISPSSGGGFGEGESNNSSEVMVASDESHVTYPAHPPEMMGHSPPHSPRATQSPLMFTPQVPVVPLQRPDEIQVPSHSWMQNSLGYEEMCNEQGIPTMITWAYGGKEVAVEGSWDGWKTRIPLQRSGKDYTIMKVLPSGVYQYRFIVDGQWRYAPDLPWAKDDSGNACNTLDLQDFVPEDLESISGFEPPHSPESSYSNLQLSNEDYAKEPPMVPPHLQMTLLNVPPSYMEIPPPLSRPQHVVLNHLYMQKGKGGPAVVALGSTHRFLAKYVTVVLYKSLQRYGNGTSKLRKESLRALKTLCFTNYNCLITITIPEKNKKSAGAPWEFVGLLPLFDPPRHDSAETIRRALDLGVHVEMITGDQLAIGKETGRRLGMGSNTYPSSSLLGDSKDESIASILIDDLTEKADGFAGVFPEHRYEIVGKTQERKHICGMAGDGKADIGITAADATEAARIASDIVFTEPGLSVIISVVLISRATFQRMKNYMAIIMVLFFWLAHGTDFFSVNELDKCGVSSIRGKPDELTTTLYLQLIIISQALIFVTRSRCWPFTERRALVSCLSMPSSQHNCEYFDLFPHSFPSFYQYPSSQQLSLLCMQARDLQESKEMIFSIITDIPLVILKFITRYALTGKAWDNLLENKTVFTTKKDYGKGERREAQWATTQRTIHGLPSPETMKNDRANYKELSELAEQAKRRAEVASVCLFIKITFLETNTETLPEDAMQKGTTLLCQQPNSNA